ncbi:Charged multivesicular body protein 1 [Intoshia linei]|uniref:Charged multivesicular body protein 1 n=1 Tax=Intoshia linei TaxID=1819745 RepID=A0A177BCL4_9BILA|nr:Charged multivesicular body protein 1 [Intoshia linei]
MSRQSEKLMFELQMDVKKMKREADKAKSRSEMAKKKVKNLILKNEIKEAEIEAENSISLYNRSLMYRRYASKIDLIAHKLRHKQAIEGMTKNMTKIAHSLHNSLTTAKIGNITEISELFEQQMEKLDIHSGIVQNTVAASDVINAPANEIQNLMKAAADEAGIEYNIALSSNDQQNTVTEQTEIEEDLNEELRKLRQL